MTEDLWRQLEPLSEEERDAVHGRIRKDWRYLAAGVSAFAALVAISTIGWLVVPPYLHSSLPIRLGVYVAIVLGILLAFSRINRVLYDQALKRQITMLTQANRPN